MSNKENIKNMENSKRTYLAEENATWNEKSNNWESHCWQVNEYVNNLFTKTIKTFININDAVNLMNIKNG